MGLSIIIPSKNESNLRACCEAIRACGEQHRIIIVDDRQDGTDWVPTGISLTVEGVKPFVFARNINIGIRAAGNDDVILLNDDAKLSTPGGFTRMWNIIRGDMRANRIDGRKGFGIVGSSCNNVGNPLQNHMPQFAGIDGFREEKRTLCFTCVLIPREIIDEVGLLDERFVDYGMDDDDYCLRVRNAGYKLGIFDGCYCDHGSLTSSYRGGPEAGGDFYPNLRRFIQKWGVDNWGNTRDRSQFWALWDGEA